MEFERKGWSVGLGLAAAAAMAVLVYFGNGLHPLWPLMWVAPLPVLLYALWSRAAWSAGLAAWAAMFAGCLNFWHYFQVLGAPPVAWVVDFGLEALAFSAVVLLMRALARRGAVWSAWLALPAVWVTFEYARNLLWPHGSAACLAYSQLKFLPFLQLASLTGPWGMSFVLLLFSSGIAVAWHVWRTDSWRAVQVLGATAAVVAAVLIFGVVRLTRQQPGPEVRVGLVASDAGTNWLPADPGAPAERLLTQYAERAGELFARGAQVVVIPENLGVLTNADATQLDAIFQPVVDRAGTMLIAGVNDVTGHVAFNEARVYTAGLPVRTYHKHHLLPPFETRVFAPGRGTLMFSGVGTAAGDRWGVEICKDMDFGEPARGYGRAGVGLMLVPGWDFVVDAFWHGHIAVMRAVEDGFSLARTAKHSTLFVADDRGRVIAETPSDAAPFATLLAVVPAGHQGTLYQAWGDWFAWFAMALCAWVLVRRWFFTERSTAEDTESTEERLEPVAGSQ
ncbi:MAG: nitrilase-related carbon-nitrogen hydrolase [Acidobacteriaceae bacterium]